MHVLRIEHAVRAYDDWKAVFENDPLGRREGGVRRHSVMRAADDPNHVLVDLEFETRDEADAFHDRLRDLWGRVDVMHDPSARVVEVVEDEAY